MMAHKFACIYVRLSFLIETLVALILILSNEKNNSIQSLETCMYVSENNEQIKKIYTLINNSHLDSNHDSTG